MCTPAVSVYANSAQTRWSGVDATGTMITDEACPIIVENEILTFDLQEFPANYYDTLEDYLSYSGKVTAEYTFYNPADYTVTATLLFPFGKVPDYGYEYNYETGEPVYNADALKYNVTVDGKEVEVKLRHTLSALFDQFDVEEDLSKVVDGSLEDAFYSPDTPVYCFSYTISGIDEKYSAATAALKWSGDESKTKIIMERQSGGALLEDGIQIEQFVDNGDKITVWIIGEYHELPEWTIYENGACEKEIEGLVTPDDMEESGEMTFKDFALKDYDASSGILENDWYNAYVTSLKDGEWAYGVVREWNYNGDISNSLLRWYEYEITLNPGERIVNTVTAPIYPSIDLNYAPAIFSYTYLLSPAQTWSEFGTLQIVINTPYYLTECELAAFNKTETGYTLNLSGLPEIELEFTLSTSENPADPQYSGFSGLVEKILYTFLGVLVLGFIALVIGIAIIIKFIKKKRGRQ